MRAGRDGFTLVELLMVVVILGILAALAIPKVGGAQRKAHVATMAGDLRNLALAQQIFYDGPDHHFVYADDLADLPEFQLSDGVGIAIDEASQTGWSGRASHAALPGVECVVYYGGAAPIATASGSGPGTPGAPGEIACDNP